MVTSLNEHNQVRVIGYFKRERDNRGSLIELNAG